MSSDLRFALRYLARSPGFACIVTLILALGIGGTATLYSICRAVLLRPLRFPEPDRLVTMVERTGSTLHPAVNFDNFLEWRGRQRSFRALGAARPWSADLAGSAAAMQLPGAQVTWDYLAAAGVPALRGRLFTPEDDRPDAPRTIVISESLWRRAFAGEDAAIGARLNVKGAPYTVIGVLPLGFIQPTFDCAFWVPVAPFADDYRHHVPRSPGPFRVLGRLRPGVQLEDARRDLETVARLMEVERPDTNQGRGLAIAPLTADLFGPARPTLLLLLGAASCVLLIASANLASLQLSRSHLRSSEFAVRAALGAGRRQIARVILLENLILGLAGCGLALPVAALLLRATHSILPASFPRVEEIGFEPAVLAPVGAAGLGLALLAGLVPLATVIRRDWHALLSAAGRSTPSRAGTRWHASLIVAEVGLSALLLTGTGLMLRTLFLLHRADLGFAGQSAMAFSWAPAVDEPRRAELIVDALGKLAALPGVDCVGMISEMPLGGAYFTRPLTVEGAAPPPPGQESEGASFSISVDYFRALQIPLLRGRQFTVRDNDPRAPLVAIIDTRLAEKHFAGRDPLGRRIKFGTLGDRRPWVEIVGVVAHVENRGPGESDGVQAYIPYLQRGPPPTMAFVVRAAGDPRSLETPVTQVMRDLAPGLPIYAVGTMDARFRAIIAPQRLAGVLLTAFAALAVLLAAVGLYGVISYGVSRRTREIGIRLALGADRTAVLGLVVGRGLRLAGAGAMLGLAASVPTTRALASLLYQTKPADPLNLVLVAGFLALVAVSASWLPARRAARVNPLDALRAE